MVVWWSRESLSLSLQRMCVKKKDFLDFFFCGKKKRLQKFSLFFYIFGKKNGTKKQRAFFYYSSSLAINNKKSETKREIVESGWTLAHNTTFGSRAKVVVATLFRVFSLFCCCCCCCSFGKKRIGKFERLKRFCCWCWWCTLD